MEWNHDLNLGGLSIELESWTQLFGEHWNGIRTQSLLFGEQSWNGIRTQSWKESLRNREGEAEHWRIDSPEQANGGDNRVAGEKQARASNERREQATNGNGWEPTHRNKRTAGGNRRAAGGNRRLAGGSNRVAGESKSGWMLGFVFCGEEEAAAKRGRGMEITTLWDFCLIKVFFFLVNVDPQGIIFIPPKNEWNQVPWVEGGTWNPQVSSSIPF